ncbi:MAG: sodium:proton antiporter [Cyanobacteria bacterium QS_8_64_29]|nr:MAG: sodium:proton antiporter [Cyanobacteria bacterium QS_8_64_29]
MAVTAVAGVGAQVLGRYLRVPGIVFLLLFGIGLGRDGLGLIEPHHLGDGLEALVSLSVAIILFEGGLSLDLRALGHLSNSLRNLVTIGTAISLLGGAMAAHYLAGLPWDLAFLYAALVVVTGPTVITPLLRQVRVDRPIATLLEGEGVLIDPVGAILALLVLNFILSDNPDLATLLSEMAARLGVGAAVGAAGGWALGSFLRRATALDENLKNLVVLAGVWGLYSIAQAIEDEAGLMATAIAGIVLSTASVPQQRLLRRFQNQLTVLAVSVLFVLLAADLSLAQMLALGWGGLLTVLALMVAVRPLNIWVCTWNSGLNWRQKLFISWIGPKGIVSASVASLFAIVLANNGISGGESVKALVFLTIMVTVVLQGLTAQWVANLLRVNAHDRTGAVIVGSNPLARTIARLFRQRSEPVALIDTNAQAVREAEREDLQVVFKNAMHAQTLEEAGLDRMGTFLAMTTNGEVNYVLAHRAEEEFEPPRVLGVFPSALGEPETSPSRFQQALAPELALKTWNQYVRQGDVKLVEASLQVASFSYQQTYLQAAIDTGALVPLALERQGRLQVARAYETWQPGDRVVCALCEPQSQLADRAAQAHAGEAQSLVATVPPMRELAMLAAPQASEVPANATEAFESR